jgi:hydroxymethylpyrimidine pyrophosphatase-like HAD family hydrolase
MKEGLVIMDMDGVQCFHEGHGLKLLKELPDGKGIVADAKTGKEYEVFIFPSNEDNGSSSSSSKRRDSETDMQTELSFAYPLKKGKPFFMDVETQKLGKQLQKRFHVVYATGGRYSTIAARLNGMDFFDYIAYESGAIIIDKEGKRDADWDERMSYQRPAIEKYKLGLRKMGWILDTEGREAGIRIKRNQNQHKSDEDFKWLCEDMNLPPELKRTSNLGHLDIILNWAGKDNALRHLAKELGYEKRQLIGIGDDKNDIPMLGACDRAYVLKGSYKEAIDAAKKRDWTISEKEHFDGINEVLTDILKR